MRRRWVAVCCITINVAAFVFACGSDYSSQHDADAGAPGASDATTLDVTPAADAETPLPDAGAATDAAASDAVALDACTHTLCETFDDGQLSRWTVQQGGNVTLSITDAAASGPYAIVLDVPGADAGARYAYLSRSFPGAAATSAIEMDVRVVNQGGTRGTNLLELVLQPGTAAVSYYTVGLGAQIGVSTIFEYEELADGAPKETDTNVAELPSSWTHLRIAFALEDGGAFTVFENGVQVALDLPRFC